MQATTDVQQAEDLARAILGPSGAMLLIVFLGVALFRKWLVMGWTFSDMEKDRDRWRDIATAGTILAKDAVEVAKSKR